MSQDESHLKGDVEIVTIDMVPEPIRKVAGVAAWKIVHIRICHCVISGEFSHNRCARLGGEYYT